MSDPPLCYISCLLNDSSGHAIRLIHLLAQQYDPKQLAFRTNEDFSKSIRGKLEHACVMLVVFGPTTLETLEVRLAQNSNDPFLQEIDVALVRQSRGEALCILPVLMGGTLLPRVEFLPAALRPLESFFCKHRFILTDDEADFQNQYQRLLQTLVRHGMNEPRFRAYLGAAPPFHVAGKLPDPHFHDPEHHLHNLRLAFSERDAASIKVLSGMGGVGKTCLALQYCNTFKSQYAGVWWFDASTMKQLDADCKHFIAANHILIHPSSLSDLAKKFI
jgi:hypothetical protein